MSVRSRIDHRRALVLQILAYALLAVGATSTATPALADCAAGSPCVNLDPASAARGDTVHLLNVTVACDPGKPAEIDFLVYEGVGVSGTATVFDRVSDGETWHGSFKVPLVLVGAGPTAGLTLRCTAAADLGGGELVSADIASLGILETPATDTAPASVAPISLAALTGLVAFVLALRWRRPHAH